MDTREFTSGTLCEVEVPMLSFVFTVGSGSGLNIPEQVWEKKV